VTLRALRLRFWRSLTRQRHDARLNEEIQTHLELLTAEQLARGLSPAAARQAALREFGGVEYAKEPARDERGLPLVESLLQDARFALRQLRRHPSFAITAILTLAIGIGGTTAIFSVLDVVVIRPLPYPDADRLVAIQETLPTFGPFPVSPADADFWKEHVTSLEEIALATGASLNLTGAGEPEPIVTGLVTPNFLRILGASPQLGRLLRDEEAEPGRDQVVVIDDALWRRRFNADPQIVGRSITLNGSAYDVVGVLQPDFEAPNTKWLHSLPTRELVPHMWKPLALGPADKPAIGRYSYSSIGRLKSGVSLAHAREELAVAQVNLVRSIPTKGDLKTVIVPMQDQMASRSRASLELLLIIVATVLLIGCVNIANLLLARIVARRREMSVREAIGASRARIARQVIVENVVLSTAGGLGGLIVAYAALRAILAIAPADVPRLEVVAINLRVLLFAAGVSSACGFLIGLVPAWRAGKLDIHASLKSRGEGEVHSATIRIRSVLVAAEIALTAAAVAVAALLLQSFTGLLNVDRGFDADKLLTLDLNLVGPRYATSALQAGFADGVVTDVQRSAGVTAVALSTQLPLTGTGALSALSAEGTTAAAPDRPSADVRSVTVDYFRALGLTVKSGRLIEAADRERNVAVLSAQLAERGWPGQNPIGRRFRFGVNPSAIVYEVIGTVGDVRGTGLDQPPTPTAYVPYPQRNYGFVSLLVKAAGDPATLTSTVRQVVRAHDPELPLPAFRTMDDVIGRSLATRRFQLLLVAFFAVLAALLASIGVYGVMAYSVAQRSPEMGIRLALGARPGALVRSVLREALLLAVVGLLIAVPSTALSGAFLSRYLVGVTPGNPLVLTATIAIIAATALTAAAGPALRASRVDPLVALRSE
jgi:putative ABC transport system permease protein